MPALAQIFGMPGRSAYSRLISRARCIVSGPSPMPMERIRCTPAAKARSSRASRSSSYRGLSRWAWESIMTLFEPGANLHVFKEAGQDGFAAFHGCGDDHAVRFVSAQLAGGEIGD